MKCFYCEEEFTLNGKQGGQNRQFCYNCIPEGLDRTTRNNLRRSLIVDKIAQEKLSIGCQKCGYNKCPEALEWHHENDDKDFTPSDNTHYGTVAGYNLYHQEIEKCILLCANCHREEHYKLKMRYK